MDALITISTNEQGSQVVSARELYEFLEVKAKFADWIKRRIIKYGFQQDTDYQEIKEDFFSDLRKSQPQSEMGRPTLDYALTIDMAKELAMVEGNAKGKEARRYFIACEKQLKTVASLPVAPTTEQVLLQQAYKLVDQQNQINQLRDDVARLMAPREERPVKSSLAIAAPHEQSELSKVRRLIHARVNEYCGYHNVTQQETYQYLYRRMAEVYGIHVRRLVKYPGASLLDTIERYGHLERLYSLIMAELSYSED